MKVSEWLKETTKVLSIEGRIVGLVVRPNIKCKDGFEFSVQACKSAFCTPQIDDLEGNYSKVEVALVSGTEELLKDQIRVIDNENMEEYYPNVPIELVEGIIAKHGGFAKNSKYIKGNIYRGIKQSYCRNSSIQRGTD